MRDGTEPSPCIRLYPPHNTCPSDVHYILLLILFYFHFCAPFLCANFIYCSFLFRSHNAHTPPSVLAAASNNNKKNLPVMFMEQQKCFTGAHENSMQGEEQGNSLDNNNLFCCFRMLRTLAKQHQFWWRSLKSMSVYVDCGVGGSGCAFIFTSASAVTADYSKCVEFQNVGWMLITSNH